MLHSFSANINSELLYSSSVRKFKLLSCWPEKQIFFMILMISLCWQKYMKLVAKSKILVVNKPLKHTLYQMNSNDLFSSLCFQLDCKMFEDNSCDLCTNMSPATDTVDMIAMWHHAHKNYLI